jgi:hypothetical protein
MGGQLAIPLNSFWSGSCPLSRSYGGSLQIYTRGRVIHYMYKTDPTTAALASMYDGPTQITVCFSACVSLVI